MLESDFSISDVDLNWSLCWKDKMSRVETIRFHHHLVCVSYEHILIKIFTVCYDLIEASPQTPVKQLFGCLSRVVPHFPPCKISLCQDDVVPEWLLIVMAVIMLNYKMHVNSSPCFHAPQIARQMLKFVSKLLLIGWWQIEEPQSDDCWNWNQQKGLGECWSDLEVYQIIQAVFSKGGASGQYRW